MTKCSEIARDAVGLASLPAGDPARKAAYAHAASCPACTRALAEGERLLSLLDALPAPPSPPPEVLERVRIALAREMAAERRRSPIAFVPAAGVLAAFFVTGGRYLAEGATVPPFLVLAACLVGATAAVVARAGALALGGAILVSVAAVLSRSHGDTFAALVGAHCLATEMVTGAMPVVALAAVLWRARARGHALDVGALGIAAVGAAGALAGQAALMMHCTSRSATHELVFHSGGVVLAALLALAGSRLLPGRGLAQG